MGFETVPMINSQTRLYGIFGNPVEHSLSPLMQNALFQKLGLNAVYLAFPVERGLLGLAFEAIRSLGIQGVNVTVPFKEEALGFVDEVPEDLDRCIGALNTIVNRQGRLIGYNTDAPGFLFALKEDLQFQPAGKKILVVGAGGAARGVVFALAFARAEKIWIYNRTPERAEGLRDYLRSHFPETEIESLASIESLKTEKVDLVVNASSCGLTPPPVCDDSPKTNRPANAGQTGGGVKLEQPIDLRHLSGKFSVYDLIYSPAETLLLKQARSLGFPSANGLGMLAAQGALSFSLWTGQKEGIREKMLEVLKKCQ